MVSLKAKLKAWVGKYRTTLARLPRQKLAKPCSAVTRVKQFTMPACMRPGQSDMLVGAIQALPLPMKIPQASKVCTWVEGLGLRLRQIACLRRSHLHATQLTLFAYSVLRCQAA